MIQIILIIFAVLVLLTGIRALTSGLDIGVGGKKLEGKQGRIAGIIIIVFAAGLIVFALVGLPLLVQ